MSDDPPKVVDLAAVRAQRVSREIVDKRRARWNTSGVAEREGATVFYTEAGQVVLHLDWDEDDGDGWLLDFLLTPEAARDLSRQLIRYVVAAEEVRDVMVEGIVRLVWCDVKGAPLDDVIWGGCRARVMGRVPGHVSLEPMPVLSARHTPPKHGWPGAGLYSIETGAPRDVPKGRRHWRVYERDLAMLRKAKP